MRVVACLGIIVICLGIAGGCSTFGKKPAAGSASNGRTGPAAKPPPDDPLGQLNPSASAPPPAAAGGILAGQVIDTYDRKPPSTTIQAVCAKDNQESAAAPVEVHADDSGYFTIYGLKPGHGYQLIARSSDGNKVVLAGMTLATPPNPKVVIRVSQDFVSDRTPSVPPAPVFAGPGSRPDSRPAAPQPLAQPYRKPAELGSPMPAPATVPPPAAVPGPPQEPSAEIDRSNIAQREMYASADPILRVPSFPAQGGFATSAPPPGPVIPPVPQCQVVGGRLENLALNDLEGRTWDFRRDHRGKLLLLDFWYSTCLPCRQAIPYLVNLDQSYQAYGLEVIGIAYEEGSLPEQIQKVKRVASTQNIRYNLLLGPGHSAACPVRAQLGIKSFPTLVLLDENGQILRRWEGLDRQHAAEVEAEIKRRLAAR